MFDDSLSLDNVLDRLKSVFKVTKDSELAKELGISPQTVSSWRQRSAIPYAVCVECAKNYDFSLDWLLYGDIYPESSNAIPSRTISTKNKSLQRIIDSLEGLPEKDIDDILSEVENRARLRTLEKHLAEIQNKFFNPAKSRSA